MDATATRVSTDRRAARGRCLAIAALAATVLGAMPAGAQSSEGARAEGSTGPQDVSSASGALPATSQSSAASARTAAQSSPPTLASEPAAAAAHGHPEATVRVFNRTIAVLRAPLFGAPPSERATRAQRLISEILAQGGPGRVSSETHPLGRVVRVDERFAFILQHVDVDRERGESVDDAIGAAVTRLEEAIAASRESRDLAGLGWGLARVAAATALAALLVWASGAALRAAARWLFQAADVSANRLRVGGLALLQRDRLSAAVRRALVTLRWVLLLLIAYHWLSLVLRGFAYTRPWGEQLNGFLLGVLGTLGLAALRALPDLLVAVAIFALTAATARAAGAFLARAARAGSIGWLDSDTLGPTRRLVSIGLWLFALAMAYPYLPGSDTDAFRGLSVLVGLMLSLGGSSLVGQAASGMVLMFTRTLRVGEYVRIDGNEGTIVGLGAFSTRIRTGMGEELSLPNAMVMSTVTRNYSRTVQGPGFVLSTDVTIGYDTPWRQVHAMLIEAARRTPGVLADPPPRVVQTALSDFYPEYRLICQAIPGAPSPRAEVMSALHANVQDVFNEYGVQIMSPHYLGDPDQPKVVPPSRRAPPPAHEMR
jgi:small-conductance mechanosensitive channel